MSLSTEADHLTERLLRPGENCWRIERADRAAFLVDGAAYFQALRTACIRAERTIVLLCWDIDSRLRLVRDDRPDGFPAEFAPFLRALLHRRRDLHVYILAWDFHLIYAFEREWWPLFPLRIGAHRRLHFQADGVHPVWASHHQKLAIIDDRLAFIGGLDPTKNRWDTPEHRAVDPRRVDPDVGAYGPFHDVQMMVSGPVAAALGELASERWRRATGHRIPRPKRPSGGDPWPPDVPAELEGIPLAIARTEPAHNGVPEVREVQHLILDAIRAARRYLYTESQYLTSEVVAAALVERLQDPQGPEVALIVHTNSTGWLEQHTMDVLRARLLRRIRAADRYGRLGIYCPCIPSLGEGCLTMHSKLMIVDDTFLRIGSANLSNRSMGFDTECDLALEAGGDDRIRATIRDLRARLLAEHLGADRQRVHTVLQETGSLLRTIERLRSGDRTLRPFEQDIPPEVDSWVPDARVIDPDRPLDSEAFAAQVVPPDERRQARRRIVTGAGLLLALLGLASLWRWGPLRDWLDVETLAATVSLLDGHAAAPFVVLAGYVVGGLVVLPVTVLIAVTILAFGPLLGFTYALAGTLTSAAVTYGVGALLGREWIRRVAGARLNRLSRRLATRGVLTVIAVRVVPVAPFSIVNLVAGASHIRFQDFLLGTVIGMFPGLVGMTVFMDRLLAMLRDPGPWGIAMMVLAVAAIVLGSVALRRWLERRTSRGEAPPPGTA